MIIFLYRENIRANYIFVEKREQNKKEEKEFMGVLNAFN